MRTKQGWSVLVATVLTILALTSATAQTSKGYSVGDAVGDFRLKNVNDQQVALTDFRNQRGLIVIFTSNHCPFAKSYEDRLIGLNQRFAAQGVPVLAIQPNDPAAYEDDSFENMKARARERNYTFPYLFDETQTVARAFGVTKTPQVYVLKQVDGRFVVYYMGAIDDNPQDSNSVRVRYVDDAVTSILTGRALTVSATKPIGCAVKWK